VQTVQQLFRQPPPLQAELKGQASGEAAVVSLQARVSSLQAEKAAMQDTAQDLISALEASGSGHPDAAALREELAAMTVRHAPPSPTGRVRRAVREALQCALNQLTREASRDDAAGALRSQQKQGASLPPRSHSARS
jgi:hypothetical protein